MTDDTRVVCATCRQGTARWLARLVTEPESPWPVCERCKDQAGRKSVLVKHEPLVAS